VENFNNSYNSVLNLSYVTGSHAIKTGAAFTTGYSHTKVEPHGDIVRLNFINVAGVPTSSSIEVRNSPVTSREDLGADLGVFVQDKWTMNRLTLTPGFRIDYLNASIPSETAPAGRFVPARESQPISCVPCWTDWAVRFGSSYDVFGNGKTALKASFGKYMVSQALAIAQSANPIRSASETRTWTDRDGNGSALDAAGNAQYDEIGPKINANFGLPAGASRFDPETPRATNWEESVSVVHEILPRVAVTAGFYHRSFQNLSTTASGGTFIRNVAINSTTDYTPYTFTGPSDARLPNGGAERITMFNLLAAKNGIVDNVSTYSTENSRVYNGFEVSVNARLPRNGFLLGGITSERTATNNCDPVNINPDTLRFCDVTPPFRNLYKLSGGYTLPYDVQVSGSLQAVPGSDLQANYTYNSTTAGVTLTGANSRTINLLEPNTVFLDYQTQLDLRFARTFRFGRKRIQGYADIFNFLNASTVASVNQTFGANWLRPLVVMQARRLQLGARFDW
jgi:hypothetical protein